MSFKFKQDATPPPSHAPQKKRESKDSHNSKPSLSEKLERFILIN